MNINYELNLRDYWTVFLKRKWEILVVFGVVFFSIFFYTASRVPLYRAGVLLKIETYPAVPSEAIFPRTMYPPEQWMTDLADYAKQLTSRPILELAAKELGWIDEDSSSTEKEQVISEISSRVWTQTMKDEGQYSSMIQLYAQFADPKKAADIANKISEVFKRINSEQQNERKRNVRIFIEQKLRDISAKLKEQDERLRILTTQGVVGSAVNIVQRISELETKLANLSGKFTEEHPDIISMKEEIGKLKEKLKNLPNEEFEYAILKRDTAINESLYTSLKQRLNEAQIKEADKIDNVILVNPAIMPLSPFYPNKTTNYGIGILLGLCLGITAGFLFEQLDTSIGRVEDIESFIKVAVMGIIPYYSPQHKKEGFSQTKRWWRFFKKDIKKETPSPIFMLESKKSDGTSIFLESFRILAVNLQVLFGKSDRIKSKLIMITSSKPEEGKTLIVSTLGITMSQMGYRVLIIDADTRRAHIHKNFGLKEKENGLTDVLTGRINADAAIKTVTDMMLGETSVDKIMERPWLNNLNIVTAGSTFPNTITLFNSEKLDKVLSYFKNQYDIVLMDTCPVLAVSEPSILLPKTDGVLLVYRAGSTSRLALRRAKIQVESIKGKGSLSGIILNNIKPEIGMDTYYYYKRYYSEEKSPGV